MVPCGRDAAGAIGLWGDQPALRRGGTARRCDVRAGDRLASPQTTFMIGADGVDGTSGWVIWPGVRRAARHRRSSADPPRLSAQHQRLPAIRRLTGALVLNRPLVEVATGQGWATNCDSSRTPLWRRGRTRQDGPAPKPLAAFGEQLARDPRIRRRGRRVRTARIHGGREREEHHGARSPAFVDFNRGGGAAAVGGPTSARRSWGRRPLRRFASMRPRDKAANAEGVALRRELLWSGPHETGTPRTGQDPKEPVPQHRRAITA
jgi:hypothetical protein